MIIEQVELSIFRNSFPAFWIALIVSALIAMPAMALLRRFGVKQTISQYVPEHAQKQGTPTMGGIIVLVGLLIALFFQSLKPGVGDAAISLIVFALIGYVDDFLVPRIWERKRGLGWIPKLVLQMVGASIVPIGAQLGSPNWNLLTFGLQVLVILAFVNAYNFADGLDGLAGGLLLGLTAGSLAVGLILGSYFTTILSVAAMGAVIPFLFLNAPPAKVFMGDVGSMPIGALLGYCALDMFEGLRFSSAESWAAAIPIAIWSIVLVVSLVPVPIQILSVKLTGKRVFAKTPIHHAFQVKGIAETRITSAYILVQILASFATVWYIVGLVAP